MDVRSFLSKAQFPNGQAIDGCSDVWPPKSSSFSPEADHRDDTSFHEIINAPGVLEVQPFGEIGFSEENITDFNFDRGR